MEIRTATHHSPCSSNHWKKDEKPPREKHGTRDNKTEDLNNMLRLVNQMIFILNLSIVMDFHSDNNLPRTKNLPSLSKKPTFPAHLLATDQLMPNKILDNTPAYPPPPQISISLDRKGYAGTLKPTPALRQAPTE
ncbi:hypothetical protein J6590_083252 [Homalodisca vitripennis]|nr:hypothetical protein J6590_083252 [Homalodisca vitripennis]